MLDFHYVTESASSKAQLSYEAFSLFVNIEGMEGEGEQEPSGIQPRKKRKTEE